VLQINQPHKIVYRKRLSNLNLITPAKSSSKGTNNNLTEGAILPAITNS